MKKLWIIIQREFAVKVKKKSFIILTILMPFLIAALIFVPALLSQLNSDKQSRVAVIDQKHILPDTLLQNSESLVFQTLQVKGNPDKLIRTCLDEEAPVTYDAVVVVNDSLQKTGAVTIYSTTEVPHEVESYVNERLTDRLRMWRLSAYHIDNVAQLSRDVNTKFNAQTIRLDKDGKETMSSAEIAGIVGLVLSLFIYMFILSYGGMVMSSVVEEKANRIVEVMVSSVKPWQLMAGKIIGTALVGLFQFLIWGLMVMGIFLIAGSVFGLSGSDAAMAQSGLNAAQMQAMTQSEGLGLLQILQGMPLAEILVLFVLYFIGGYLLFAAFFAAIGASVNEQQDTQQFMMPIVLIFVFALYAGMFSMENPDGPLALWCSFIPFTSPVVMMVRIPFQIPFWQIALSLLLLYGTAAAIVWVSAKIYRVGILMYGKKPTFGEMLKWLKFK